MSEILQIFSGNPLTTFIGKKIEAATRPELESDDWALNLEICDIINENDDDAKDAVRAIRKRLQQIEQDRNFIVTNRTLTVLETCVSNGSRRFHVLVMTKDFIQDLVKLIGPKNNPPIDLQERVLRMIERWADAFKGQPELGGVVAVYNELKSKGVTFPERDLSSNVPIQTPQRSVPPPQQAPIQPQQTMPRPGFVPVPPGSVPQQLPQPLGPVVLEGESHAKIIQDLSAVQTSVEMFDEILGQLESKKGEETDWRLAADMDVTCHQMRDRVVDLIERVANEDLTIELLRLNDELNNIFTRYECLMKNKARVNRSPGRTETTTDAPSNTPNANVASSSTNENELSLIDFNVSDSGNEMRESKQETLPPIMKDSLVSTSVMTPRPTVPVRQPASTSGASSSADPLTRDLDKLFLGSSPRSTESNSNKKSAALPEEISSVREQDFAEIENWLKTDSGGDAPSIEPISIPNSEFDNFIASRALAGSSAVTPASASTAQQNTKSDRKPEPSV